MSDKIIHRDGENEKLVDLYEELRQARKEWRREQKSYAASNYDPCGHHEKEVEEKKKEYGRALRIFLAYSQSLGPYNG